MTEQKLLEKLTGVNNPRFITPREDAIIKECLTIINELEEQLLIHSVSIEFPDDAIHFAEWLDIVGIRDGRYEWKYKADNYKQKYTTKEMFAEWKRILGN